MVDEFCTVSEAKPFTRIRDGYSEHDGLLLQCIQLATAQIKEHCRRSFSKTAYVEYFPTCERGDRPSKFYLTERNVATSPALVMRLDYGWPTDWTTVTPVDALYYRVDREKGILTYLSGTYEHPESIRIEYTAGYDTDTGNTSLVLVPVDVRQAAAIQSAYLLEKMLNQDIGQTNKNASGVIKTLRLEAGAVSGLVKQAASLLSKYRPSLVGKN